MTASIKSKRGIKKAAFEGLFRQFVSGSCQTDHIRYDGQERPYTVHCSIKHSNYRSHLCGRNCFGARYENLARFAAIDLDLHAGDLELYVEQLASLAEWASRQEASWHFQVAETDASGVHLLLALNESVDVRMLRYRIQAELAKLDRLYPSPRKQISLAERHRIRILRREGDGFDFSRLPADEQVVIRRASMRFFSETEIYPHPTRFFRLPPAPGRVQLCDRPISDPNGYWGWLSSDRKRMTTREILGFVIPRLQVRSFASASSPSWSSSDGSFFDQSDSGFVFSAEEMDVISEISQLLSVDGVTAHRVVCFFLRFVSKHKGEIAQEWLPELFFRFPVLMRRRNKRSGFLKLLIERNWIIVLKSHRWQSPAMKAQGAYSAARQYVPGFDFWPRLGIKRPEDLPNLAWSKK